MTALALKKRPRAQQAQPVRKAKAKRVFLAKPERGEVDFAALRNKVISRFPKTLAYLAK